MHFNIVVGYPIEISKLPLQVYQCIAHSFHLVVPALAVRLLHTV